MKTATKYGNSLVPFLRGGRWRQRDLRGGGGCGLIGEVLDGPKLSERHGCCRPLLPVAAALVAQLSVWPSDLRMAYFQLRCTHY